ncbi:hypothetical protein ACWCOP_00655 [Maricaulaceae bacterium MS644]
MLNELKLAYSFIYLAETAITIHLVKRLGLRYGMNIFARALAETFSPYALFLLPLALGTFVVAMADFELVIMFFVAVHGWYLANHLIVWIVCERGGVELIHAQIQEQDRGYSLFGMQTPPDILAHGFALFLSFAVLTTVYLKFGLAW